MTLKLTIGKEGWETNE